MNVVFRFQTILRGAVPTILTPGSPDAKTSRDLSRANARAAKRPGVGRM